MGTPNTVDGRYREFFPSEDYWVAVSRGRVDGATGAAVQGRRTGIAASSNVDLIPSGSAYAFLTSEAALEVLSSSASDTAAGTGARTVLVRGLDDDYAEISEVVTLNGTTPVALTRAYMRVNAAVVVTAGSTGSNVGTVTLQVASGGAVQAEIPPGYGRSQCGAFTVPAAYQAWIVDALFSQTTMAANDFVSYQVRSGDSAGCSVSRVIASTHVSMPSLAVQPRFPGAVPPRGTVSLRVINCSASATAHGMVWLLLTPA